MSTIQQEFSTTQIARLCGVRVGTVCQWFDSGKLAGYRLPNRHRRVKREVLVAFMKERGLPLGELAEQPKGEEEE